ncbi:MAG: lysylphosphatidylglycerol synthase transmembrane domain-containing protein [Lentisphaeria bacterium]|nr:lysylphosphatidylglycerol synthase transmembrane domain-containing protein [Lentisphaeria bacterium]
MPESQSSSSVEVPVVRPALGSRLLALVWRILVLLLAFYLLHITLRSSGADLKQEFLRAKWPYLLLAFALNFLIQAMAAWRWSLLMSVQQMRLPYISAFKLSMAGNFFSLVIPGAVSGDLLKVAYAGRLFSGRKTEIFLTVLLDRVLGLFAMFIAALLASLLYLPRLPAFCREQPLLGLALLAVNLACLGMLLGYFLIVSRRRFSERGFFAFGLRILSFLTPGFLQGLLARLQAAFQLYRQDSRVLSKHITYSTLVHILNALVLFCLGKALGEKVMSFLEYCLATQVANTTGLLPLTPGGIGVRDAVSSAFFKAFAAEPASVAGSIPVMASALMIITALLGALFFVCSPRLRRMSA